jgi:hypothetical protein
LGHPKFPDLDPNWTSDGVGGPITVPVSYFNWLLGSQG